MPHTALHCITLRHTASQCTTPHHTASLCITLHHSAPHDTTPHHNAPHCATLHHTAPHCTTPHLTIPRCTTWYHTTSHCTTLHHISPHRIALHHTAPHHTTLHHTALHNTTLHGTILRAYMHTYKNKLHWVLFTFLPLFTELHEIESFVNALCINNENKLTWKQFHSIHRFGLILLFYFFNLSFPPSVLRFSRPKLKNIFALQPTRCISIKSITRQTFSFVIWEWYCITIRWILKPPSQKQLCRLL